MKVSLITPTRERPNQLSSYLENFIETTQGFDVESIVVADGCKESAITALAQGCTVLYRKEQLGAVRCWNDGLAISNGDILVLGADDLVFYPNWLENALRALNTLPDPELGMVGFNDLSTWQMHHHLATHWLITRRCLKEVMDGVMAIPVYHHYFFDPEMCERARNAGCFVIAEDAIVEHKSHMAGKAELDNSYAESEKYFPHDQTVFDWRKERGFPIDWKPVI